MLKWRRHLKNWKAVEFFRSADKSYAQLTGDVNDQITALTNSLKAERAKLDEHTTKENIEGFVKTKLASYYGVDENTSITLETLLEGMVRLPSIAMKRF